MNEIIILIAVTVIGILTFIGSLIFLNRMFEIKKIIRRHDKRGKA